MGISEILSPGHHQHEPPLLRVEIQCPPNGPESPASGGAQPLNNPGPKSPKSNPQLEALAKELAEMRAKLAQKETESLDFRTQLSKAQQQLTVSQGEALRFQQQLGQAQQTAGAVHPKGRAIQENSS